jgi:hypothetical protein
VANVNPRKACVVLALFAKYWPAALVECGRIEDSGASSNTSGPVLRGSVILPAFIRPAGSISPINPYPESETTRERAVRMYGTG